MMVIDQASAGQQIQMAAGAVAELRLPENPTTGYRWAVVSGGSPVCLITDTAFHGTAGPPGQGGAHTWELRAVQAGTCTIELVSRRSFAPDAAGSTAFSVKIEVGS